ncbi:GNAT family N-acetyltransferase [Shewanella gelidii]|uniref:N-acetyltransferase n=1 Tax=Shewanella gelidii TaxID=1642821 RepID=A0A917N6N3_9GAMM|nr:GNAT family N-acetyltransferase [Shewanella gelidii]MCL1096932.1 GNAT family N-acetyltransferase [Shewanella gelidii]GGI71312.1 N-acetyltransferase [Shewanella gelidii]
MIIREATQADFQFIWPIFREVAEAGDTYAFSTNTDEQLALQIWLDTPRKTFVAVEGSQVVGTYYLKTNHSGPGAHVCNCGYMVAQDYQGKGLATAMCEHSQVIAKELGYKAMQFNFVASTNTGAVRLWHKLGFQTVGQLPKAFEHPSLGYVDALVMYKWL